MAAHVGRDNLLAVLRAMLELPNCSRYFPELQLRNGRLHKVDATGSTDLEATDAGGRFANLIAYLNPGAEMEMQEASPARPAAPAAHRPRPAPAPRAWRRRR